MTEAARTTSIATRTRRYKAAAAERIEEAVAEAGESSWLAAMPSAVPRHGRLVALTSQISDGRGSADLANLMSIASEECKGATTTVGLLLFGVRSRPARRRQDPRRGATRDGAATPDRARGARLVRRRRDDDVDDMTNLAFPPDMKSPA
jgi:hypothetical protein